MLAWIAAHEFTLIGVIFMLVIGPAVGNYACSVVYRLPRGKTPFERHPFCGHCNADLKPIDLFPIFSWVSTRGKCRYCAGVIPGIYTVIEVLCAVAFVGYFLAFGISEHFLLCAFYATFVITLWAIQVQQGWIASTIYVLIIAALLIVRALSEHTIYGTVQGAFLMLLLCIPFWRVGNQRAKQVFDVNWLWWMVLLGAAVPISEWGWLLPVAALAVVLREPWRAHLFMGASLLSVLLIPQ